MWFREERDKTFDIKDAIKRCSGGSAKAQEHLFKHFYAYVMSIAIRYSYCSEKAAEIMNDSFLKVFQNLSSYQTEKEFKVWLRKITINTAIDHYRKEKKFEHQDLNEQIVNEIIDESYLEQLHAEELIKILQSLPEIYRLTFSLYEIDGYSHDEIAKQFGIAASTSRSNLTRAKKILRQLITKHYNHEKIV